MKHHITILMSAVVLALNFSSCQDEEQTLNDASSPVVVNRFYPTSGGVGTEILITGKNFSTNPEEIKITVGERELKILKSDMNNIMAIVPAMLGNGPINVQIGSHEPVSTIEEFQYVFTANVSTLAGNGEAGYADGIGTNAIFHFNDSPDNWRRGSVCVDSEGNVFAGDVMNYCIRKIAPDGTVTTFAGQAETEGTSDGTGSNARFRAFYGMETDSEDNIYLTDVFQWTIRKVTPEGNVTTLGSTDNEPWSISVDERNGDIYYTKKDAGIWKWVPDGTDIQVSSSGTAGIAIDDNGNIYACDVPTNTIKRYAADTWEENLIIGNGQLGSQDGDFQSASFHWPSGIRISSTGDLYVACEGHNIRRIDMQNNMVYTIAGTGTAGFVNGQGKGASFNQPQELAVDKNGNIYVSDKNNNAVRKIIYQ